MSNLFQRGIQYITGRDMKTTTVNNISKYDPVFWNDFFGITGNQVAVTANSALQLSTIYTIIDRISSTIAYLPLRIYKKQNGERILMQDHDQLHLLAKAPHPLYTAFSFWRAFVANYQAHGNGIAIIHRNTVNGRPFAYELKHWGTVTQYIGTDQNGLAVLYYHFADIDKILHQNDVLHISDLNFDGYSGMSKISLHKTAIGSALSANEMGKKVFEKGLFLGGFLKYPTVLSGTQIKQYAETFEKVYAGVSNVGKTGILDGGSTYEPLKYSMPLSDIDYINNKNFSVEEMARIFNFPVELLSTAKTGSYNSMEQIMIAYVQSCLTPIVTQIEQELVRKIFRPSESNLYVKKDLSGLLRGDNNSRAQLLAVMHKIGALNTDEIRELDDRNKVKGGDEFFIEGNNLIPLSVVKEYYESKIKESHDKQSKVEVNDTEDSDSNKTKITEDE